MRRRKWTQEQILEVLRAAEAPGVSIKEVCRIYGVNWASFYRWRNRYDSGQALQAREQRHLEQENARLKQLLATRDLEIDAMKRVLRKNSPRHSNGDKP